MVATFAEMSESDAQVAEAAGALNLAHAALTRQVVEAVERSSWSGTSPVQWLVYQAGLTRGRAEVIVAVAERRHLFPSTMQLFDAGKLSLEQTAEIVKAPPSADGHLDDWGLVATPSRIRKSIKMRYGSGGTGSDEVSAADESGAEGAAATPADRLTVGVTDDQRWQIRGEFDLDTGLSIEAALLNAREELWARGQREISQADCLREVFERYGDGIDSPLRRDRNRVWLHLEAATGEATESTGIRMPDSVRDKVCCDGIIQPVWERDGVPFNLGRSQHIVPQRTRRAVMRRDGGCRVPGCDHARIIEIHHIIHWIDGGPTDTWNLVALCPKHHRMHHQAGLASPATPTSRMGWCSPTDTADDSNPAGCRDRRPASRCPMVATGHR
ncbi:MAG: HNH endonuclease [Ilumatobacteraceae bacterium]